MPHICKNISINSFTLIKSSRFAASLRGNSWEAKNLSCCLCFFDFGKIQTCTYLFSSN